MFTCPDTEIQSLYLDNELPKGLAEEFEAHIASCQNCRAKFESLKKTHEFLKSDSNSISLDDDFLNKSFERLSLKMRYIKNAVPAKEKKVFTFPEEAKKYMPAAVAAAVVFAIMLPFSMAGKKTEQVNMTVPVAQVHEIKRTTDFSVKPGTLLPGATNVAFPINLVSPEQDNGTLDSNSTFTLYTFNPLSATNTIVITQYKGSNQTVHTLLQDDFFTPDFTRTEDTTALQVYMPSYVDISSLNK